MSDAPTSDLPVRDVVPAHRFDEAGLHAYLRARLPEVGHRLEVRQFQGGASNPTFLLTTDGHHRFVLRKKPPGQLLSSAHQVDFEAVGLGDYGRHSGYFERQVARWTRQYRDAESESIPAMDALIERLPARIPADQSVSIAHGDYRLENVMFHPTENRIIAVLDWELSTIGHPLADIAYNAFLWRSHGVGWGSLDGVDFKTSGIPTEAEYVAAYCRRTGRGEIADWPFLMAFSIFRLASISQGVYRRVLAGNASTAGREAVNGTPALAGQALAILEGRE